MKVSVFQNYKNLKGLFSKEEALFLLPFCLSWLHDLHIVINTNRPNGGGIFRIFRTTTSPYPTIHGTRLPVRVHCQDAFVLLAQIFTHFLEYGLLVVFMLEFPCHPREVFTGTLAHSCSFFDVQNLDTPTIPLGYFSPCSAPAVDLALKNVRWR